MLRPVGGRSSSSRRTSSCALPAAFLSAQLVVLFCLYLWYDRKEPISPSERQDRAWEPSLPEVASVVAGESPRLLHGHSESPPPVANANPLTFTEADAQKLEARVSNMVAGALATLAAMEGIEASTALAGDGDTRTDEQAGILSTEPVALDASVSRLSDEIAKQNPVANIPGVENIHEELKLYKTRLTDTWMADEGEAFKRQHRVTAEQLHLTAEDPLDELESLPERVGFLNDLLREVEASEIEGSVRLAVASTTSADLWGVRRELFPWMQYHLEMGVRKFYLLYDGTDQQAIDVLQRVNVVELIHIHAPWATPEDTALWNAHANVTQPWAGRPGNYELMVKQGFCESEALRLAASSKLELHWLLHLDPDELLLPGNAQGTISAELARVPAHIPAVRFMNFEGQPEAGGLQNRYEQVTLFRMHKHFITPEAFAHRSKYKLGANAAFLNVYANGKSAVRVDAPGARHSGPHYFAGPPSHRWKTADNPTGAWVNAVSDGAVILHYAYSYEGEVEAKAKRSCPGEYRAAAIAGNRSAVKDSCFVIDFDADAYMASVQGPEAVLAFFYSRMVLSEGSPVRCLNAGGRSGWCALTNIPRFTYLMEKLGLMRRVLMPQALFRQQERAIQRRIRQSELVQKQHAFDPGRKEGLLLDVGAGHGEE